MRPAAGPGIGGALAAAGLSLCLAACEPLIEPLWQQIHPHPAAGAGTALALQTVARARLLAGDRARQPPTTCGAPRVPPSGPWTCRTDLHLTARRPGQLPLRLSERRTWQRDPDGATSVRIVVTGPLPDGRTQTRSRALMHHGDRTVVELDGVAAAADRLPEPAARIDADRTAAVDDLLSTVRWHEGALAPAQGAEALCPPGTPPAPDARVDGALTWTPAGRSGWLRWQTPQGGVVLVAQVQERCEAGAPLLMWPEVLHPVDPDESLRVLERMLERGLEAGWLEAVRAPADPAGDLNPAAAQQP
jgi:hypothetical protein